MADWKKEYRSFESARNYARSLKLKNNAEWSKHTKTKKFPKDIPANVIGAKAYKNKFISVGDFLGTGSVANQKVIFWNYKKAKNFIQKINLKSYSEYKKYLKKNNFTKIPKAPHLYYNKSKQWKGWSDFLGKKK